jgi:pimeloyl-ACP methyl ester carboxylesterase
MHENATSGDVPPVGQLYEIGGGRRLMLHRAGSGAPPVVFEAGGGAFGLDYFNLLDPLSRRTTVAVYDRAGRGWSDPIAGQPRPTTSQSVQDLHELLQVAGIAGSYLLVGHSLGGLLVRAYAQRFPNDVFGLVLVDPAAEGMPMVKDGDPAEAMVEQMIQQIAAKPSLWREWQPEVFEDFDRLPPHIRDAVIARHMHPDHHRDGLHDMMAGAPILAEVAKGSFPTVPVIVLTGMKIDKTPGRSESDMLAFNKLKLDIHRNLVNSLAHAEHRVFEDVGHRLNAERPDLVVNAIFDLIDGLAKR